MLVSSIGSAQTFDFSCGGPDVNGITTHDGFEVSDNFDNIYENPSYPSITLDYITHGNPKVPGIQIQISTVITQTFLTGTSQEVYDLSVAWVLENRSPIPTQTCTPTLSIAEGVVLNSPGHANDGALINGIIIRDPSSILVTYLPGDELPMDFTEYEFRINTHFARSRVTNTYDGSCGLVINGTTDNVSAPACTPTLSIAEGAVYDRPGFFNDEDTIEGIWIDHNNSGNINDGETYPNGSNLPTGEFNYAFYTLNSQNNPAYILLDTTTGQTPYDGSCELVINGDHNRVKIIETFVINVPEELEGRFHSVQFFIVPTFTTILKEDGSRAFFAGDEIPSEATHHQIRYYTPDREVEHLSLPGYNPAIPLPDGDLNITADIFPNVINIPEALNPWIQRITFQDIQNNSIKHTPDVGGNETNIYDDGDFIPEEATHYRIRIRRTLGTNNGSYETEQISVPSSGDLNIELTTLTIQTGLAVRFLGLSFLIQGLHVNGTDYTNGSPLPSGSYNNTRVWFYNQHGERSTFSLDSHNILDGESVSLTTESSPNYVITLASVLEAGGDLSGHTYNLAGKTYTISDEGSAGHTYRFQSANDPVVFFVGSNSLSVADGRIVFGASSIWDGGHVINTTGTEELERALPLVTAGIKIFYPNGRSNVTDAFFAIESDFLVTDAANMNKNIIDLTPVNGITVFPGDENVITSGSDFSALVTESRYYAYVLTNNKIGVGLVTGSGASLVITDTENNLKIGSARGGTLLWEINGPRRINDVGEFKYIKVVNQRNSSWDDVEGYYRIHPAINGGFTDQTSASYQAAATSGNLTVVTTVDPDMISEQAGPGDFFVIRDNSIDRQGFTVAYARSRQTAGLVYGLIFSFGAPNLGTSLNFNVGHAQKLTNPVLQ